MTSSVAGPAAQALALAALFGAAIHLLKHGGHYAEKRDNEASQSEKERDGLPQGAVAGKALLKGAAHKGHAAGDEREEQEGCGKNVEIAGHFFYFIASAERLGFSGCP